MIFKNKSSNSFNYKTLFMSLSRKIQGGGSSLGYFGISLGYFGISLWDVAGESGLAGRLEMRAGDN